jgi:hypothetical protein
MPSINATIVNVNAQVTPAAVPSTLQQSGALVSVDGTTQTTNTYVFYASLTALQAALSSTGNYQELNDMATTYFAQNTTTNLGVYVLELGAEGSGSAAIAALTSWIAANPNIFYAYLTPATWDAEGSTLNTLAELYESPTSKTYFFVTTTSGTISAYAGTKSVYATVPSPTAGSTEFQAAVMFYNWLANAPSAGTPAAPMQFRFVYGVTPWVQTNNQSTINSILSAYGNIVYPAAEGGISNSMIMRGTTMDGNQSMGWYAIDWLLINAKQELAAALIEATNSFNPIYFNQTGINRLLAVLQDLCVDGISYGLFESAIPAAETFIAFIAAEPADYALGIYTGFSCTATPQLGFQSITFNLEATQFAA